MFSASFDYYYWLPLDIFFEFFAAYLLFYIWWYYHLMPPLGSSHISPRHFFHCLRDFRQIDWHVFDSLGHGTSSASLLRLLISATQQEIPLTSLMPRPRQYRHTPQNFFHFSFGSMRVDYSFFDVDDYYFLMFSLQMQILLPENMMVTFSVLFIISLYLFSHFRLISDIVAASLPHWSALSQNSKYL